MGMLSRVIKDVAQSVLQTREEPAAPPVGAVQLFHSDPYVRHTARRLEHLASLRIPVEGMSVLEVGAGIGDLSHYFLDRGCTVTITEARSENLAHLAQRYPNGNVQFLDLESPSRVDGSPFDVVLCYGTLYHLSNPKEALDFLSESTSKMLFLETCVSFGEQEEVHLIKEPDNPTQAYSGMGCRPTRSWLFRELRRLFQHVYVPTTQPCHSEFPLDWTMPEKHTAGFQRAVFIASRTPLDNEALAPSLLSRQARSG